MVSPVMNISNNFKSVSKDDHADAQSQNGHEYVDVVSSNLKMITAFLPGSVYSAELRSVFQNKATESILKVKPMKVNIADEILDMDGEQRLKANFAFLPAIAANYYV